MRRREFLGVLSGAAATWPLAAGAQQTGRLLILGFLGAATPLAWSHYTAAFAARLRELFGLGLPTGLANEVRAQVFPDKPIRFFVPFPAGGSTDAVARALQPALERNLGQPVVVENRLARSVM